MAIKYSSAAPHLAQVALGQVQVGELDVRARAQHERAQVPRLPLQQRARYRRRACKKDAVLHGSLTLCPTPLEICLADVACSSTYGDEKVRLQKEKLGSIVYLWNCLLALVLGGCPARGERHASSTGL